MVYIRIKVLVLALGGLIFFPQGKAHNGFTANRLFFTHSPQGQYRIEIHYTHVEVGEYRIAHIDFKKKTEALKVFESLRLGATFYLGMDGRSLVNPGNETKLPSKKGPIREPF